MSASAGTVKEPIPVPDLSEGFAICRERNRPIVVCDDGADGVVWKLWPSGRAQKLRHLPGHTSRASEGDLS